MKSMRGRESEFCTEFMCVDGSNEKYESLGRTSGPIFSGTEIFM
jgi:hypothetical protein